MTFNREKVLKQVAPGQDDGWSGTSDEAYDRWTIVKDWIKDMVRREPVIMARVARKTFSDLGSWIVNGSDNVKDACGCLVGSTALELIKERNHFFLENGSSCFSLPNDEDTYEAYAVIPKLCKVKPSEVARIKNDASEAGTSAADLGIHLGQNDAVALIKSEIRLQLKLRQNRVKAAQKAARTRKRNA